jgi:hypothetical protein
MTRVLITGASIHGSNVFWPCFLPEYDRSRKLMKATV